MNTTIRDLAIDLYKNYQLNPEDLPEDGKVATHSKEKGVHFTNKYAPLVNYTSEEIYQWEVENGAVEICDMCKKVRCTCDDDYQEWKDNQE